MKNKINKERRRSMNTTPTRPSNKSQWQGAQEDPKRKTGQKHLCEKGLASPIFMGMLFYKLRKILGHCNFSVVFTKIIKRFIKRDYDHAIL
jgi:hypothetical protein